MSRTKEAVRLIRKELQEMRIVLLNVNSHLTGIEVAVGEFHHDVEGQQERQDQELAGSRVRVSSIDKRLKELEGAR